MNGSRASRVPAVILAVVALAGGYAILQGIMANAHDYALMHRSKEALERRSFDEEMAARYRSNQARYKSNAGPRR